MAGSTAHVGADAVRALAESGRAERLSPAELLQELATAFHPRLALACSFQQEDVILLDVLLAVEPRARVFALDTHVLFPETYALWRDLEKRYGVEIETYSGPSLGRQAAAHGDALWERNPDLCCALRKVGPLNRALGTVDCWITGIRRAQSPTRANAPKLGWDEAHGVWKASPLADWSDERVAAETAARGLPVNGLYAQGYASIGCVHCTLPGAGREGRWAGKGKTECGLHA